jgi:predicted transcriptional regulator
MVRRMTGPTPPARQVLNALATVEQATAALPKPEPAAPVRRSVFPDHIVCLGSTVVT